MALVCFCSAIGATLCYLLSQLVGRRLVKHFFPERAAQWAQQVNKHRDELLSYMLFLRMTPFLPNWFINLVAPVIGVPLYPFALGTFLGKFNRFQHFHQASCFSMMFLLIIDRCRTSIILGDSSRQNFKHHD